MKFVNHTPFPAGQAVGSVGDLEQILSVACKVTYQATRDGGLLPLSGDLAWPVVDGPTELEGMLLPSDLDFRQRGTDLHVLGAARAPHGEATREMRLGIRCGAIDLAADVIGDRRWEKDARGRLVMSRPAEFTTMPLDCAHAFGGSARYQGAEMPYAANPEGRGFIIDANEAPGTALPNLERPGARIREWQDRPVPICLRKPKGLLLPTSGPDSEAALSAKGDADAIQSAVLRYGFNGSVPDLICPRGGLGRTLELRGFSHAGPIEFALPLETAIPDVAGPVAHVDLGGRSSRFPLSIASIVALVDHAALVVTWRTTLRYLFEPRQLRAVTLIWFGATELVPRAERAA